MDINRAKQLELGTGRYDCCGNLFFEINGKVKAFGVAAQIEFLATLQESIMNLTDDEKTAFNTIIDMLYAQKYAQKYNKKPVAS